MPVYEFECGKCGRREEVFARTMNSPVTAPECSCTGEERAVMERAMSPFARHRTMQDQVAEAEAKYGKEVDAAMGPTPEVDTHARRYDRLAKDLPPE